MSTPQECVDAIKKAVGDDVTDDELDNIFTELDQLIEDTRARDVAGGERAVVEALAERTDEIKLVATKERLNAARNKLVKQRALIYLRRNWGDKPWDGLRALLVGTESARAGTKYSTGQIQNALMNRYTGTFITRLDREGVLKRFKGGLFGNRGELDLDIYRAMDELAKPTPKFDGIDPDAVKVAKAIAEINDVMRLDANRAGAAIKRDPAYVMRQTHDADRIRRAGFEQWYDDIKARIDWQRTLTDVPASKREAEMRSIYNGFVTGAYFSTHKKGPISGLKGIGNVGKSLSHERVLHFKDGVSAHEYNHLYGVGNIAEGMLYGMERMALHTGLMRTWGPNAEMNYDAVVDALGKQLKRGTDTEALTKFDKKQRAFKKHYWPNLTGESNVPGSRMAARWSQIARSIQVLSKLGGATLSAFADIPFYGSEVAFQGRRGLFGGMAEAFAGVLRLPDSPEKKRILASLGVLHDGMRASIAGRFDVADNPLGTMAKTQQLFFTLNGLRWWTDRLRTSMGFAMSNHLARSADLKWGQLTDDTRRIFGTYGIDEGRWDLLRRNKEVTEDGTEFLTPDGIDDVPDEAFADYLKTQGQKPTAYRIRELRRELKDQFSTYFHDRTTTAVLEPDKRTRGILLWGSKPGTVDGEVLRHATLFKSFSATVIQKVVAREVYGRGAETAMEGIRNNYAGMAQLIIWNTLFGYGAMTAKDALKGRNPRPWLESPEMFGKTLTASMLQGGGLGIYGDFLFGDMKTRYGGGALETVFGPSAGSLNTIADLVQGTATGDTTVAEAVRAAVNHAPFINLFWSKWALDYFLLYQMYEGLNPGYLRRMERRIEREQGQTFFAPPSRDSKEFGDFS